VTFELCASRGFDAQAIARRLRQAGLAAPEVQAQGAALQSLVIVPNCDAIVDSFFDALLGIEGFNDIVGPNSDNERLKSAQQKYIRSIGVGFDQREYFESRLRIGSIHQKIGVPQSLYQCTFHLLQCQLIRHIPRQLHSDQAAFENLLQFILKITLLDMSLAVESYCADRVFVLEQSLDGVRGEKERLHKLAVTDGLTELHNHAYTRHSLADALQHATSDSTPLCIIMADLDYFKQINDTHGHLVGDQILRIAAERMLAGARTGDEIGRYGGEEFLFILRNTDIAEGRMVAERVRERINSDAVHAKNIAINISLSLGIAQAREGDTVDALIDRADAALYAAKLGGRDRVCLEHGVAAPAQEDGNAR